MCMNGMSENKEQKSNYTENNIEETTKAIETQTHTHTSTYVYETQLYTHLKFTINNDALNFGKGRRLE